MKPRVIGYWHKHVEHAPKGEYWPADITPSDSADGWTSIPLYEPTEESDVVELKPCGLLAYSRHGGDGSYHRDSTKEEIIELFNKNLNGGPYSAEYVYKESDVIELQRRLKNNG